MARSNKLSGLKIDRSAMAALIKEGLESRGTDMPCPHCGKVVHVMGGENRCPHCGGTIDVSFSEPRL